MGARHPTLEATHMEEPLIEVELIPPQGNEFGHAQAMAIGQENHRVITQAMPPDTPGRLAQAVDLGFGEILTGADVSMFVALGKRELRHQFFLDEQLSCFRWLAPHSRWRAA